MHPVLQHDLDRYLRRDRIAALLRAYEKPGDESLTVNRWLWETPVKRMIFDEMYGDLLFGERRLRVLDVAGGVTALTRLLTRRHDYHLIDLFAHDRAPWMEALCDDVGYVFWTQGDWYSHWPDEKFDLIVANDLFPSTDQRLGAFLERALPSCRELRLTLTYFRNLRYYLARRVDADEILCLQAYDGSQTSAILGRYRDRILGPSDFRDAFETERPSLYPNGRQVVLVTLRGLVGDDR